MNLSPQIKGLITAALMIGFAFVLNEYRDQAPESLQNVIFVIYALGITWTLIAYNRSGKSKGGFRELFSVGFRCFIVVTLCMVVFTFIFLKMHPEFATIEAAHQREELLKLHDKTPSDIETLVSQVKKQYSIRYISASIFGYLIIGAGFTAAASLLLQITRRK